MIRKIFLLLTATLLCGMSIAAVNADGNMSQEEFNLLASDLSYQLFYIRNDFDNLNSQFNRTDIQMEQLYTQYSAPSPDPSNPTTTARYDGRREAASGFYQYWEDFQRIYTTATSDIGTQIAYANSLLNEMRYAGSTNNAELAELVSLVRNIKTNVESLKSFSEPWFTWANDVQGAFKEYFSLVNERLKTPDSNLPSDLLRMWEYLNDHLTNVVTKATEYDLSSSLQVLQPDGTSFRLSNEGYINAANLAVNERSYLTLVDINNKLTGTNTTDLAIISNYLYGIQRPFFELVNRYTDNYTSPHYHWSKTAYTSTTNFYQTILQPFNANKIRTAQLDYAKNGGSNVFHRIENALLAIYGAWTPKLDFEPEEQQSENLDQENLTRNTLYSTNAIRTFVENVGSVTNSYGDISSKFKEVIESFEFENVDESSFYNPLRLTPEFEFGEIEFPYLHFTIDQELGRSIRTFFIALWYVLFAAMFFKIALRFLYLFGRAIAHTFLVISTLLS